MTERTTNDHDPGEGELFRLLVENIKDYAIFITDPQGRVQSWNTGAERLLGYREDEILGKSGEIFFTPEDVRAGVPQREMEQALREGGGNDDRWHVRKDGSRFWSGGMMTALWDDERRLRGFAKIMRDRTEWKTAQIALENQQKEAARQQRLYEAVLANTPDLVYIFNLEHRFVYANEVLLAMWGKSWDEAIGKNCLELGYEPWHAAMHDREIDQVVATRQPIKGEVPFSGAFGRRMYEYIFVPVLSENGEVEAVAGTTRDVTERREAEERLRHSEERFRSLMEQAPFSIQIFSPDGRTLRVNRAWEELWGFSFSQLENYNVLKDPQLEAKGVLGHIRRAFAGETERVPAILYNPNDTLPGVTDQEDPRRWLSAVIYPLKDSTGQVQEVVLIHEDITASWRAEEQRQRSEQLNRTILESISDGFFAVDRQWRFTYVNSQAEHLLGRAPGDLPGKVLWDEYPGLIGSEFEKAYVRAATERVTLTVTSFYPDHQRWYEVRVYPATEGISVYFRDVTEKKQAEAEVARLIETSEQQRRVYETVLSSTADFNYVFDLQGRFAYVNRALLDLWGKELHEAVGKNFFELDYPPPLAERLQQQIQQVISTRRPVRDETPYTSGRGERQYEYIFVPVLGTSGTVVAVAGSTRDITERKQAEAALRDSETRFRQLADAMPQIVWTARPDGTIDYLNQQWQEFTGITEWREDEDWAQIIHPDDAAPARESWANSLRSGAPFESEIRLWDRRTRDYRWHLVRTVAVRDEAGTVVRWYGTSTDIDAQKQSQDSFRFLAEASAALARVVDYESTLQKVASLAVPTIADWAAVDVLDANRSLRRLGIAHCDPDKIRFVRELMAEYPPDLNAPTGIGAVLHSGEGVAINEITDDMLIASCVDDRHLSLVRTLGLRSYICVPLIVSGSVLGAISFATAESGRSYGEADFSLAQELAHRAAVAIENNQLYEALREADRRKDEFLATLAHELRNPLAPLHNSLQILKMPWIDAATAEETRNRIERQLHHLVRLVDDLLDVSRVMRGKIHLRKEPTEVATLVARAVETAQPLIEMSRHQLHLSIAPEPMRLDVDPVRLTQVIGNLLTNAAKYTEPQGQIWLTAQRERGQVVLKIKDSGIGIASDILPHVFDLFVQAGSAATRSQGGLGIGLTLVKNLVEMHGGTVEASSPGLGKGSEFTVRLPLMEAENEPPKLVRSAPQQPRPASGHRLLVVDDNQDAALSLATLLRLHGHEVFVAHDGPTALQMADTYHPQIVFLDLGMPGMDGYEVARQLRQNSRLSKIVLAALTGWGQQEDRRRTIEAGFDYHLVKPLEPDDLQRVLASLNAGP